MHSSPHLRALWSAALCCAMPLATRAAEGPCIEPWQSAPVLLAAAAAPVIVPGSGHGTTTGAITTSSDQLSSTADGVTELTGHVDVHMGDREIQADRLTYDRNTNNITASGAVRYRDPVVLLQGDSGHYNDQGAAVSHGQFELAQQPGHGSADQISMTPAKVITLRKVTYSSCPSPHNDWQIRARDLTLDREQANRHEREKSHVAIRVVKDGPTGNAFFHAGTSARQMFFVPEPAVWVRQRLFLMCSKAARRWGWAQR